MISGLRMVAEGTFRKVPWARGVSLLLISLAYTCAGADWPQFLGVNHDGISTDRITTNWTGGVTNPVWRIPLTNALCSLVVSGGKVYTHAIRTVGGLRREVCVALSETNGVELWAAPLDSANYPNGGV